MEVSQNTNLKMIDKSIKFFGINIAILTISDTRNFDNDKSGSTLKKLVKILVTHVFQEILLKTNLKNFYLYLTNGQIIKT